MDNIMNYQQMLRQFNTTQETAKEEGQKELEEKKKNLLELTQPFEQLGFESFGNLFKKGVVAGGKKALNKLGLTEAKAKALKNAYEEGGHKGVLNELRKSLPSSGKELNVKPEVPPSTRPQLSESAVEDLLPEQFKKTEGVIKNSLKSRISNLTGDQQQEFTDKVGKRYVKDLNEFGGDRDLAKQYNLNQASKTLDEIEGGEKSPFSIQSISRSDYSDPIIRESLIGAVKQERDELHPLYRQQFNNLMSDRLATADDIGDSLLREKFNLHQASRTLDEVKGMSPSELLPKEDLASTGTNDLRSAFTNTLQTVGNVGDSNPTQSVAQQVSSSVRNVAGDVGDFESEVLGQAKRSTTQVFKTGLSDVAGGVLGQAGNIAQLAQGGFTKKNLESIAKNEALSKAQDVGEKAVGKAVGSAVAKGTETAGETIAEGGGPEDIVGDVIGAIAGVSTVLGGIFHSRHLHRPSVETVSNVAYQIGA